MNLTLREWIIVMLGVLFTSVGILANNWYVRQQGPAMGVVDTRAILQAKQRDVTALLMRADATPEQRQAAIESAGPYAARVGQVLEELVKECRCVLVNKDLVVVPSQVTDYTETLATRVGVKLGSGQP